MQGISAIKNPHNPNPCYVLRKDLPPVLKSLFGIWVKDTEKLHRNLQIQTRRSGTRCRKFREPRLKACGALMMGLLAHVNLASSYIYATASDLAHSCGLVTTGQKAINSIARCTRALYELNRIGLIEYQKPKFNPEEGIRPPLFIRILPRFWEMFDQDASRMIRKQQTALIRHKKKLTGKDFGVDVTATWEQESLALAKALYREVCEENRRRNSRAMQLAKARQKQRQADYRRDRKREKEERQSRRAASAAYQYNQPRQMAMPDYEDPGIHADPAFGSYFESFSDSGSPPVR